MTGGEWPLEYFVEDSGRVPVREFVRELDEKTYARLQWSFEHLRQRNVQARQPLVRHIDGRTWELREESRTNIYQVLYFFFTGRRIVLLHGFQKKTRRRPQQELAVARQRLGRFLEREGGE